MSPQTYVQYLNENGTEPLGDRGVVFLDGRRSLSNLCQDARECNGVRRPVFPHFEIRRGTLTRYCTLYRSKGQG